MMGGMEASQLSPSARGALSWDRRIASATAIASDGSIVFDAATTIERLLLVEPRHFDRPFDGSTRAVDFEGAIGIARDGDNAPVELGGVAGIDLQLLLAGALALLQRRIVEKRQAHGPLDLQCPVAAEKNHRGMGVDPLAALGRTEAGTIEKIEHLLLQVGLGYGCVERAVERSWLQHGGAGDLPGAQLRQGLHLLPATETRWCAS